jgi:predicted nucleic acid-binding protein
MTRRVVLDASVGVKWIRDEGGTAEALGLLSAHGIGELEIVVASLFCYEYLAVARRERVPGRSERAWQVIRGSALTIVEIDDALVVAAIEESEALDCSFYDAVAPALARLLGAQLYSADHRAHAAVPGVVLVG